MIPKHALELIQYIRLTGKKLSKMEDGFVSSVFVQAKANRLLTDRQSDWLQKIYAKVTDGGKYQSREHIK